MKAVVIYFLLLCLGSPSAWAINTLWGTSHYMGSQPCAYDMRYGDNAVSRDDIIVESKAEVAKITSRIKQLTNRQETLNKRMIEVGKSIESNLLDNDDVFDFVSEYLENYQAKRFSKACVQASTSNINIENVVIQAPDSSVDSYEDICPSQPNSFCLSCLAAIKSNNSLKNITRICKKHSAGNVKRCEQSLKNYIKYSEEESKLTSEIERLESEQISLGDKIREREWAIEDGDTEADVCLTGTCDKTKNVLKNGLISLGAAAIGVYGVKEIAKIDADLSFRPNLNSGLLGLGLAAQTYGALSSGVGLGAYGCSHTGPGFYQDPLSMYGSVITNAALGGNINYPSRNQYGAFQYPPNFYNAPHGGNIFNQGLMPGSQYPSYGGNGNYNQQYTLQNGVLGPYFTGANNSQCLCYAAPCSCAGQNRFGPLGGNGQAPYGSQFQGPYLANGQPNPYYQQGSYGQGPYGPQSQGPYLANGQPNPYYLQGSYGQGPYGPQSQGPYLANGQPNPYYQQGSYGQGPYGPNTGFNQNSIYQMQAQAEYYQYLSQQQEREVARRAQISELQAEINKLYTQMNELSSGSLNSFSSANSGLGYNIGVSAGASFNYNSTTTGTPFSPYAPTVSRGGN